MRVETAHLGGQGLHFVPLQSLWKDIGNNIIESREYKPKHATMSYWCDRCASLLMRGPQTTTVS
jgi:hypothetical protein